MTREELNKILIDLAQVEGNGVFIEADGTTSFNGFNQKTYDAFRKNKGLPAKDVRSISVGESLDLLKEEFVERNGIEKLPDQFKSLVVDTAFNSGPKNAAILVQRTVGAEEDGIIGPKTLAKLEEFTKEKDFIEEFSNSRVDFILNSNKPEVQQFQTGIINRIENVRLREKSR